jgi:Zn-dependent peptidase ImmA (M78 family)
MPDPRSHARRIVAEIAPDVRDGLSTDTLVTLESLGFRVVTRPELGAELDCSVAGSFHDGDPPTICITESMSVRRSSFTALHEYGHKLVYDDVATATELMAQRDGGRVLEERICDSVAAELLIPGEVVDRHVSHRGPTAWAVAAIFEDCGASREACCVRASERIRGPGYVMLARDGIAVFTASHSTPYRIRRNTTQAPDHPLRRAAARPGVTCRGEASVTFSSGQVGPGMFTDAYGASDGWVFVVAVETSPAWQDGAAVYEPDRFIPDDAYCEWCSEDFHASGAPCSRCGVHRHSTCGRCGCRSASSKPRDCTSCFYPKLPHEYVGDSPVCKECQGI